MRRLGILAVIGLIAVAAATHAPAQTPAGADAAARGQLIFEQSCTACHTIGQGDRIGPDLHGVTTRQSREWLLKFIAAPDQAIAAKDPVVMDLMKRFNQLPMPNLGLTGPQVQDIVAYLESAAAGPAAAAAPAIVAPMSQPELQAPQSTILIVFLAITALIAIVFAWIGTSTRSPATVDVHRAYGLRRIFFILGAATAIIVLVATIPNAPYAKAGTRADRIVYVAARQFDFVYSDEPITSTADLSQVARIQDLQIPAGTLVEFRVTSLDVTHGFGLYGPDRQIIAQTQAMPGYFNRLLVRLDQPAEYKVLCLEYCAAGHHLMQTHLVVTQAPSGSL